MITNQKLIPALFLVIGLVVGFGTQMWIAANDLAVYREELKARVMAIVDLPFMSQSEVKQLSGTIQSVQGQTLIVALQYPKDPFGDPALDTRTVTLDSATNITLRVQKDFAVFQKELTDYDPNKMLNLPQPFTKKEGTLSSLNVGQTISITTLENVKEQKSFIAATIEISTH